MKITFRYAGKKRELRVDDLVKHGKEITSQLMCSTDNPNDAFNVSMAYFKALDAKPALDNFKKAYTKYAEFRKENPNTDNLSENDSQVCALLENGLAIIWNQLKRAGHHSIVLYTYPQLKPLCEKLELVYKELGTRNPESVEGQI